jgi:hypothetical protein
MTAMGQKQTSLFAHAMSTLPPKADIERHDWHVCLVPGADEQQRSRPLQAFSLRQTAYADAHR